MKSAAKKTKPILRSLLPPYVKKLLAIALVLSAFMLANTVYLLINRLADLVDWRYFAAGATSLPHLFQSMVLAHTGVGLLLVTLMLAFAVVHLPRVWVRHHKSSVVSGTFFVLFGLVLLITGLLILTDAASRDNRWAWWTHVLCAVLAPAGYLFHRMVSYTRPAKARVGKYFVAVAGVAVLLVLWHGLTNREIVPTQEAKTVLEKDSYKSPDAEGDGKAAVADDTFVPVGFVPPNSPFFPSAATTTLGHYLSSAVIIGRDLVPPKGVQSDFEKYGFVKGVPIGAETCKRCHADIVAQWQASAHRFASFNNPFYTAAVQNLRENADATNSWVEAHLKHFQEKNVKAGMVKSQWCGGCHDPALMFAGKMKQKIDRSTPEAQAGLTCLACHAINRIHNRTGNGTYNLADEQEDPYLFANASSASVGTFLHDAIVKAKPTVHKRQMLKPFFRTSEFCASCHKVSLIEPVNNYRWLRGQDEYDNWHDSGVSQNASRTFYLPPVKRQCQDCHMPKEAAPLGDVAAKNGYVRSHRFLAVNTALPFIRGDQETIERIEAFLRQEKLRVDIFALKSESMRTPAMAIDLQQPILTAGEKVTVDVVVRNQGVGHTFPGGTNDSNEGWLEFSLLDAQGNVLAISGWLGDDGHLDPMAHVFKAVILDKNGQLIHQRNAQDIHVTVFANVIGPGTADIAHYEFVVPPQLTGSRLTLRARLLWRKFDRKFTQFAFESNREGFKQFDRVPDLPVTEIATDQVSLPVRTKGNTVATDGAVLDPSQWVRFNDYGIGLLLEGDTRGAALAFAEVAALRPNLIEGPLNLAKTAVRDGNLDKAYDYLQQCEAIQPGDARVAWTWGLALQEDGQYAKAKLAYRRVLEKFPQDRAAWRKLGRTYYLDQKYEQALQAFAEVLKIDPEDRVAHYHRLLCFQALGQERQALLAKAAYETYQVDESAQEITRAYRLKNPGANLMAQKIRTHVLQLKPSRLGN
ncbi:MAG: tetratricopeptide repeat protein [bacterium]